MTGIRSWVSPARRSSQSEQSSDVCLLKDSIASGEPRSSHQGRMTDKDGVTIPIRANYMALRNEKNVIVGGPGHLSRHDPLPIS